MIKAIFFDMGGVLRSLDLSRCWTSFRALGWENIDEFVHPTHQKQFIGEFERGEIDTERFLDLCCSHCRPGTTHEQARAAFLSLLDDNMDKAKADFLNELKAAGYELFILSNNNPISSAQFVTKCAEAGVDVDKVFTRSFYSFEMRLMKPYPEIYREAIRLSGYLPAEILFVDDSQKNLDAARAEGIQTLLYTPGTDLKHCVMNRLI